jgi:hypothetical protein
VSQLVADNDLAIAQFNSKFETAISEAKMTHEKQMEQISKRFQEL